MAIPLAVLVGGGPEFSLGTALLLAVAYGVACRVQFAIGFGYTSPSQLVLFPPMLFLLPPGAVPLVVTAGLV